MGKVSLCNNNALQKIKSAMRSNSYRSCSSLKTVTFWEKKETPAQVFLLWICEKFKNTYLVEHLRKTASNMVAMSTELSGKYRNWVWVAVAGPRKPSSLHRGLEEVPKSLRFLPRYWSEVPYILTLVWLLPSRMPCSYRNYHCYKIPSVVHW